MNSSRLSSVALLWLLGACFAAATSVAHADPVVGFDPTSQTVTLGNQVSVDIVISDLGDGVAPSLAQWDFDVTYDDTILDFVSVAFGTELSLNSPSTTTTLDGVQFVGLTEMSNDSAATLIADQAPAFVMATLTFDTIGTGTTLLGIDLFALKDTNDDALIRTFGPTGSAKVTVTPEPGALLLVALGIGGAVAWRRRRRQRTATRI